MVTWNMCFLLRLRLEKSEPIGQLRPALQVGDCASICASQFGGDFGEESELFILCHGVRCWIEPALLPTTLLGHFDHLTRREPGHTSGQNVLNHANRLPWE